MSPLWILVMCPALASAMSVELVASTTTTTTTNSSDTDVRVSGSDVQIISDFERKTFKINDDQIREYITKTFGDRPSYIYFHSPTPHFLGDLYKSFGYEPVRKIMKLTGGKVVGFDNTRKMLITKKFRNKTNRTVQVDVGVSESVQNTISSTWTDSARGFIVGKDIDHTVSIETGKIGVSKVFKFIGLYGKNETYVKENHIIGFKSMLVSLNPGQSVTSELSVNLVSMKVQVEYVASLKGIVATYNVNPHDGNNVMAFKIESNLKNNSLPSTETLDIEYYYDSQVEVCDVSTGALLVRMKN